jgi:hypothetical protein
VSLPKCHSSAALLTLWRSLRAAWQANKLKKNEYITVVKMHHHPEGHGQPKTIYFVSCHHGHVNKSRRHMKTIHFMTFVQSYVLPELNVRPLSNRGTQTVDFRGTNFQASTRVRLDSTHMANNFGDH